MHIPIVLKSGKNVVPHCQGETLRHQLSFFSFRILNENSLRKLQTVIR